MFYTGDMGKQVKILIFVPMVPSWTIFQFIVKILWKEVTRRGHLNSPEKEIEICIFGFDRR